jgi:hypothetical protein
MISWNFAEATSRLGDSALAERAALIHEQGLAPGAHVGHYMRNAQNCLAKQGQR